ncbi:MAG TPA: hypoxanthine phosphoribosyltransferase [Desulfobacteraceae bacterium]|nr:hypoxanthine phosphoribosyltransferase [Desulfobacteraceae bacterium]HPJ68801.1 hypoxanthine phosphoribosyltransferase [Desulfobacteraceae bacterium]HPQ27636.1 hypoxanthine phosphoribosyltransferase [Desulfobacteraceae bacterium]
MKTEILIPKNEIRKRVKEIAEQISFDCKGKEPVLIGVLNGVIFFFADLVREISIPTEIDFIRAASYGSKMVPDENIQFTKDIEISIDKKPVILVEDIIDTGSTLSAVIKRVERKGADSIKICALINKLERRDVTVPIDYCGFQIEEGFIVGYGLDYNQKYRYLPDICILK